MIFKAKQKSLTASNEAAHRWAPVGWFVKGQSNPRGMAKFLLEKTWTRKNSSVTRMRDNWDLIWRKQFYFIPIAVGPKPVTRVQNPLRLFEFENTRSIAVNPYIFWTAYLWALIFCLRKWSLDFFSRWKNLSFASLSSHFRCLREHRHSSCVSIVSPEWFRWYILICSQKTLDIGVVFPAELIDDFLPDTQNTCFLLFLSSYLTWQWF